MFSVCVFLEERSLASIPLIVLTPSSKYILFLTVSDQMVTQPILFMAQYFGMEIDLSGDVRTMKPQIVFLYDFHAKCWNMLDIELSLLQSNHINVILQRGGTSRTS